MYGVYVLLDALRIGVSSTADGSEKIKKFDRLDQKLKNYLLKLKKNLKKYGYADLIQTDMIYDNLNSFFRSTIL
jgi:hypothetical protein